MNEKDLCKDILRYGTIIKDFEHTFEYDNVFHFERYYVVEYNNKVYRILKRDGEFIYLETRKRIYIYD